MSVITFYGDNRIETAQTTSMAAVATYLSIEENYKILLLNTKHNDSSLQECFWDNSKNPRMRSELGTGISGLMKAIASNKASPEIITNYTRTIFKDRLEILTDNNILKEDYNKQKEQMKTIIKIANKYYDLIFVDLEGNFEEQYVQEILEESNLVIASTSQRIKYIKEFKEKNKRLTTLNKNKLMYLIGKYDKYSKYNMKNIQRTYKMQEIYEIPYNTILFEASNEGKLADFIIKYRGVKQSSTHYAVMESISQISQRVVEKLKELQMQV